MKKIITALVVFGLMTGCTVCFSACADGKEYSVNCVASENGAVIVADTKVEAGENVILGARPDKGYKLVAFVLDGETLDGCSFVMPEKDVKVSARFDAVTYSVTYVSGDATVAEGNPQTYTVENAAEIIDPEMDGYEVCGWYRYFTESEYNQNVEDFRVTSLAGITGNLTLYARYYNPIREITVADSVNGWCYPENYEARYGDTVELIVEPETGYELDYAAVNGNRVEGTSFTMPMGGAEVSAVFKPIEYEITYVLDGGENSPYNPQSYTVENDDITLYGAVKEGYTFIGWFLDEECNGEEIYALNPYEYLQPLTLYAKFEKDEETDTDF